MESEIQTGAFFYNVLTKPVHARFNVRVVLANWKYQGILTNRNYHRRLANPLTAEGHRMRGVEGLITPVIKAPVSQGRVPRASRGPFRGRWAGLTDPQPPCYLSWCPPHPWVRGGHYPITVWYSLQPFSWVK